MPGFAAEGEAEAAAEIEGKGGVAKGFGVVLVEEVLEVRVGGQVVGEVVVGRKLQVLVGGVKVAVGEEEGVAEVLIGEEG